MDEGSTTTKEAEKTVSRITLNNAARVFESQSYAARGDHRTHDEQAVRLSYLGRVHVNKPDLEVVDCPKPLQGSARLYSSEYGRFMAVDKLWEEFEWITPYAYAENSPLRLKDPSGEVPIDTFWDGLNVVVDFGRVVYHTFTGNTSKAKEAAKDLAADGLALAIPYVPAGLTKLRHVDDAVDAVKTADKAADATKAGRKGAEGADQVGKGSASREPKSLPDQMALEQAKKGGTEAGRKDIVIPLKTLDIGV